MLAVSYSDAMFVYRTNTHGMNTFTISAQSILNRRLAAAFVDFSIVAAPFVVWRVTDDVRFSELKLFVMLCLFLYWMVFQSDAKAATPGKRLFGLKVQHISGRSLTFWEHFGRALGTTAARLTDTTLSVEELAIE